MNNIDEQIKEALKNLSIELEVYNDGDVGVKLTLDDEVISESYVCLSHTFSMNEPW